MEKGNFKIAINPKYSDAAFHTVSGLKSKFFGMHKEENGHYAVTHLSTGFSVFSFPIQKEARQMIINLEKENINWNLMTAENAYNDYSEIVLKCKANIFYELLPMPKELLAA